MSNDTKAPRRKDQSPEVKLNMILAKTVRNGDCMEWAGNYFLRKNKTKSYPYIYYSNKVWRGNRLVLFLSTKELRKDQHALHTCDNMKCLNPRHLYWGTHQQNVNDMYSRGRDTQSKRESCPRGHPYSGANLRIDKEGKRKCRSCAWYRNNHLPLAKELVYK